MEHFRPTKIMVIHTPAFTGQPIKARAVLLNNTEPCGDPYPNTQYAFDPLFFDRELIILCSTPFHFSLSKLYSHNKMSVTSVKLFAKVPSIPTILLLATIAILSVVAFYTLFLPRNEVSSRAPKQTSHQFYRLGALSFSHHVGTSTNNLSRKVSRETSVSILGNTSS